MGGGAVLSFNSQPFVHFILFDIDTYHNVMRYK